MLAIIVHVPRHQPEVDQSQLVEIHFIHIARGWQPSIYLSKERLVSDKDVIRFKIIINISIAMNPFKRSNQLYSNL